MNKSIIFLSIFLYSTSYAIDINDVYKRCAACHGLKGEVQALGRSVPLSMISREEFINSLKLYKDGKKNVSGLGGIMQAQVYTLNEKDFETLADFFYVKNKE